MYLFIFFKMSVFKIKTQRNIFKLSHLRIKHNLFISQKTDKQLEKLLTFDLVFAPLSCETGKPRESFLEEVNHILNWGTPKVVFPSSQRPCFELKVPSNVVICIHIYSSVGPCVPLAGLKQ